MASNYKVGQTWLSDAGNLFRITGIRDNSLDVERIGFVQDGAEYRTPISEFVFGTHLHCLRGWRIVSRNPENYDRYLATCPEPRVARVI